MTLRCYRVLHCQASVWNMFCLTSVKDLVHIHLRLPILAAPTIQSYGSLWFSAASWSPLWLWCCKPALTSWAEWSGRIRFHRSTGLSPRHWESVTSQPWKRFFWRHPSAASPLNIPCAITIFTMLILSLGGSWKEPSQSVVYLQENNLVLILDMLVTLTFSKLIMKSWFLDMDLNVLKGCSSNMSPISETF